MQGGHKPRQGPHGSRASAPGLSTRGSGRNLSTDVGGRAGHPSPDKLESPNPSRVSGGDCLGLRVSGRHAPGLGGTRLSRGRGFHGSTPFPECTLLGWSPQDSGASPARDGPTLSQQAEGLEPGSAQLALRSPRSTWAPALQRIRRLHFFPDFSQTEDTHPQGHGGQASPGGDLKQPRQIPLTVCPCPEEKLPCLDCMALSRPGCSHISCGGFLICSTRFLPDVYRVADFREMSLIRCEHPGRRSRRPVGHPQQHPSECRVPSTYSSSSLPDCWVSPE